MDSVTLTTISTSELKSIIRESVRQALFEIEQLAPPANCEINKPLTVKEAAKLLNLAVSTLYGLTSKGEIPYSKKGKRLYFSKHDLLAWVESGKRKSACEIQQEVSNYLVKKRRG